VDCHAVRAPTSLRSYGTQVRRARQSAAALELSAKAADFMSRDVEKGPALGAAEDAWIGADFTEDPDELDAIGVTAVQARWSV